MTSGDSLDARAAVDGPSELGDILLGRLRRRAQANAPWVRKHNKSVQVRSTRIEFIEAASMSEMQFACVRPRASRPSPASHASSPDTTARAPSR